MTARTILLVIVATVAVPLAGSTAFAQARPERPYRGLFGNGGGSDAEQELTATGSLGAGYDTSVLADASDAGIGGTTPVPTQSRAGTYGLFSAGLAYTLRKERVDFDTAATTSARYYPTLDRSLVSNYGVGIGGSWSPTRRTRLSANQTATYQPFSLYTLFPIFPEPPVGQAVVPDLDFNTLQHGYYSYTTSIGASRELSRRSSISGEYSRNESDFSGSYPDFSTQTGAFRYTRGLKAGLGLRIGYGYTEAFYAADSRTISRHSIDTGVDFSKTLSFSRRTRLSFSTGGAATAEKSTTYFTAVGSANLTHELGRTWQLVTTYDRNVGFVETFATPYVYDAVNGGVSGLLGRRLSFHAGAGAVLGRLGLGAGAGQKSGFDTFYASSGVAQALTRYLSVGVDYSFYRYAFDDVGLLPAGFDTDLSRHSLRISLNTWIPLMHRGRKPDAAR